VTRAEHLAWAKQRAFEYVEAGDLSQAVTSYLSDLSKHEDLCGFTNHAVAGAELLRNRAPAWAIGQWIEEIK
jgi:hypothetical protein